MRSLKKKKKIAIYLTHMFIVLIVLSLLFNCMPIYLWKYILKFLYWKKKRKILVRTLNAYFQRETDWYQITPVRSWSLAAERRNFEIFPAYQTQLAAFQAHISIKMFHRIQFFFSPRGCPEYGDNNLDPNNQSCTDVCVWKSLFSGQSSRNLNQTKSRKISSTPYERELEKKKTQPI